MFVGWTRRLYSTLLSFSKVIIDGQCPGHRLSDHVFCPARLPAEVLHKFRDGFFMIFALLDIVCRLLNSTEWAAFELRRFPWDSFAELGVCSYLSERHGNDASESDSDDGEEGEVISHGFGCEGRRGCLNDLGMGCRVCPSFYDFGSSIIRGLLSLFFFADSRA